MLGLFFHPVAAARTLTYRQFDQLLEARFWIASG
jgi:hypothetical protein